MASNSWQPLYVKGIARVIHGRDISYSEEKFRPETAHTTAPPPQAHYI